MRTTDQQLTRIRSGVLQLLKRLSALEKENQQLREELGGLRETHARCELQLEELKQRAEIRAYLNGEINDAEKKQLEKRLAAYLKEIDRCIAMLGQ